MAEQRIPRVRLAHFVSLMGAALLAACGGGKSPADTSDATALAAPASVSIRYAVGESSQEALDGGLPTRQLNVVDTRTGQVVWQTSLGSGPANWAVSSAYQVDADRLGLQYQGPRQLYYVQSGKVYQMDISAGTLLQSQRISSVTNACNVDAETHSVTADGLKDWLTIDTAGPDGSCEQRTDNEVVTVFSNMPTSEVGPTYAAHAAIILVHLSDALGQSLGMLTLDATGQNLVVRSDDLKRDLYTVLGHLTPGQPIYTLSLLPSQSQMALIQVGTELHVLDWRSGQASMGPTIATLTGSAHWPIYTQDGQTLYVADGLRILAISGTGTATTWTTLPAGTGTIEGLWQTTHAVLAVQTDTSFATSSPSVSAAATPAPVSTLWSIDKSTQTQRTLDAGPTAFDGWVSATDGDTVFYSVRLPSATSLQTLLKVDAQGANRQTVATTVSLVTASLSPRVRGQSIEVTKLLWCEAPANQTTCNGGTLVSYGIKTAQKLTLGQLPASNDAGWPADYAYLYTQDVAWEGAQSLVTSSQGFRSTDGSSMAYQSKLWLFDANQANSFRQVLTTP